MFCILLLLILLTVFYCRHWRNNYRFLSLSVVKSTVHSLIVYAYKICHSAGLLKKNWIFSKNLLLSNYTDHFVFVKPFPRNLEEVNEGIVSAMSNIDGGMIQRVWDEVDSRIDVRLVTPRGAYWAFVRLRRNCGSSFISCVRLHVRVILAEK